MGSRDLLPNLANEFYPLLRVQGFKGSGSTLRRIESPVVHVFNIQRSSGGEGFYVNLGAHLEFLASGSGDTSKLKEHECAFRRRLDSPRPELGRWRYPGLIYSSKSLVRDLVSAWEGQGMSFFQSYASYPTSFIGVVRAAVECPPHPGDSLVYAQIGRSLGMLEEALGIARTGLESAPPRASGLKAKLTRFIEGAG